MPQRERSAADRIARLLDSLNSHGLIRQIQNPDVPERCLEPLAQLCERIEKNGSDPEYENAILEKIYEDCEEKPFAGRSPRLL